MVDGVDKVKNVINPDSSPGDGGKYVDDYKYLDKNKPGMRRVNGRMRDVYDQSRQTAYNPGKPGRIQTWWLIPAGIATLFTWFLGFFIVPKLGHTFPFNFIWFFRYNLTLSSIIKVLIIGLIVGGFVLGWFFLTQDLDQTGQKAAQELLAQDYNDAYVEEPTMLPYKYDIVPDNKVHFDIDVTAILSHMMIKDSNKVRGKDGKVHFDNHFSQELFNLAGVPNTAKSRILYDAAKLAYNPNHEFGKQDEATVKDEINHHWWVDDCEDPDSQDPSGVYIVSTAPENTVVIAETRGGKGQKIIEPTLDTWSRQKDKPNIVATDLKMELLRKELETFTIRGYNVRALNLLVSNKTDAINFIGYAADAAIRGDVTKMEELVTNIADIYFPKGGGSQDPMWNNAASTVFKRTVYGLIDYYNEQVRELKRNTGVSSETIALESDKAWGHVTLFNAYKFVVELAAKTYPQSVYEGIYPENGDPDPQSKFKSGLTIYFDATAQLPQNPIREKIANQDKALKSSAKSEKMMASIYGICLFGMIFFTDNKIIQLTSARPSNNLDLQGFSFPRRLAVKFNKAYAIKHGYKSSVVVWECYRDPAMTKKYEGKDFFYEGTVDPFYWANAYFKGIFDQETVYIKLTIYDPQEYKTGSPENLKLNEFDFIFKKGYRKSFSGRQYAINLQTGEREVQGGVMIEYTWDARAKKARRFTSSEIVKEHSLVFGDKGKEIPVKYRIIDSFDIHYAEKPTALFLVAPPNTASYNKILLITIDMLYNQQVSASFLGFSNQKPLYKTKYMLDEFGNMKSDGHGVPELDTKLSSGLGQDQQFTLILQSLSQLSTLYDDKINETLQSNVGSFIFIKSKDKQMIQSLIGMNGKKHVTQESSQTFDKPAGGYRLLDTLGGKNGQGPQVPHISTTTSRDEREVISENDYLRLSTKASDGTMIVSRGTNPIWSQQPTIMPMSFRLFDNRTGKQGDSINPNNLPMISDAENFDPLANLPNFDKMIHQRIVEATYAHKVIDQFKKVEHKTDNDIQQMDPELFANRIMAGIHDNIKADEEKKKKNNNKESMPDIDMSEAKDAHYNERFDRLSSDQQDKITDNNLKAGQQHANFFGSHQSSFASAIRNKILNDKQDVDNNEGTLGPSFAELTKSSIKNPEFEDDVNNKIEAFKVKKYAGGNIAAGDLQFPNGSVTSMEDDIIGQSYADLLGEFKRDPMHFEVKQGTTEGPNSLYSRDGKLYIEDLNNTQDPRTRYQIEPAFIEFLLSKDNWNWFAGGRFETTMRDYFVKRERDRQDD